MEPGKVEEMVNVMSTDEHKEHFGCTGNWPVLSLAPRILSNLGQVPIQKLLVEEFKRSYCGQIRDQEVAWNKEIVEEKAAPGEVSQPTL